MSDAIMEKNAQKAAQLLGQSRYRVDIHGCNDFLDVLSFSAEEALSKPWYYDIALTCENPDIACDKLLLKPGSFTFQTPLFTGAPATEVRSVYGVVQSFRRVSTSADETHYTLRLVPRIALMQHTRRSEIYLNQSVIEVVENVLREHELEGADFEFRLSREYPERELITQWRETDLEFVQRLLAEVGIFWRFEMDSRLGQDVVIFMDSPEQYQFGVTLPLRHPSGMSDSGQESVWDLRTAYQVVSGSVATRDYNYREALTPQDSTQSVSSTDGITTGEVYHYAEPFLTEGDPDSPETGAYYARLRHERLLNGQSLMTGRSTSPHLLPGQVLEVDGSVPQTLTAGIVITRVRSRGSRRASFLLDFEGIPYSETVCFRPSLRRRPVISGTLPARVESTRKGDIYAWLDETGRYRVKLDVDRTGREQGYAYLWLRLAKPYAGDNYGWHAPLLDGTEVSVAFDSGDPDRPYIAHAQHDSAHPDHVTRDNHTRNVLRTPANNKLRMEDQRRQEHIKLATEYGKTQLNLGHLVDAQRQARGTGFELRTDEYGAVRAAKGIYLSAHEQMKAQGPVAQLHSAVVLASAPSGVALSSGEHLQLTSTKNTMINAGQHLDVGAMKNLSVTVEKALGLFVHKDGAKVVANQGEVEIQAQHNTMSLFARDRFTITSNEDEIVISTPETLTLNGGGSYLKLSKSGIEHGSQGDMLMKVAMYLVTGTGATLPHEAPEFSMKDITQENTMSSKAFND
ncbi:type VI secretion system tip protein VgrG [Cronobacter sakazakii]|uniref:type VI secretion system Vgr family protein n=1 Tax=Cronobacter sakazakii TaxID=28141 RepID=UPI00142BB154|nr:type VI secretion system tip protein VgrG [Cronobacter sakazakii]ELY4782363.1 type VI secretion system tip protein VgrG [Cronobacter sakazakii]KAB0822380.1 type VI secretion system tip protein VgrG [Cronobacter sakazakii]